VGWEGDGVSHLFTLDMVFVFEHKQVAEHFFDVLPKRLSKYGLEMHMDKSQLVPSGHIAALRAHKEGKRIPTFKFLGFTCYWGKSRKGYWRLKYSSRRDRFSCKLKGMRTFLRKNLNTENTAAVVRTVIRVVIGWINYHGISDNHRRVKQFIFQSQRVIFKWLNRRGRRKPLTWKKFELALKAYRFPTKWKTISMF